MDGSAFRNTTVAELATSIAKPQKAFAVAFAVLATALAGCASGLGANTYERGSVGMVSRLEEGTVVGVRPIRIEGSQKSAGVGTPFSAPSVAMMPICGSTSVLRLRTARSR